MSLADTTMRGVLLELAVRREPHPERAEIVRRDFQPVRHDQALLSGSSLRLMPTLGLGGVFSATQILTGWTNVSTAKEAVKDRIAEMKLAKRAPQISKNWSSELGQRKLAQRRHRA